MTHAPLPGPGWHPDPHQPGFLRYWDGRAWTAHTSPVPAVPSGAAPPPRSRSRIWWTVAAVIVLAFVGVGALSEEESPEPTAAVGSSQLTSEPTGSPTPDAEATAPEPTREPTPEMADVPRLEGEDRNSAERLLDRSGLTLGSITKVWSMRPSGTVLEQELRAGAAAAVGTAIALVVSKAIPSVPGTAGRLQSAAVSALKAAGYRVAISRQTVTSGTDGAVLRQSPVGGTRVKPGDTVRLVVANVVRPVVQAPAPAPSSCTTGYDPCLPPMSDYDCSGGSGDGPGYTGPVRVTGSDPYQLDNDGDGLACES